MIELKISILDSLKAEIDAICNLSNKLSNDESLEKCIKLCFDTYLNGGKLIFSAVGKSADIARKTVSTLKSTGTPSEFIHPTEAFHGDLGSVTNQDIFIIFSHSGNTVELVSLVDHMIANGFPCILITGNDNSILESKCEICVKYNIERESCPFNLCPTVSSTMMNVLGNIISVSMMNLTGFTKEEYKFNHPGGSIGEKLNG